MGNISIFQMIFTITCPEGYPMNELLVQKAPNFTLNDYNKQPVSLSDYKYQKNVVLVFNRSFFWPFCRRHMAQLRQDYDIFLGRETVILVVGPDKQADFQEYWSKHELPFIGLPDPEHHVADLYGQQVKLLRAGRMPALMVIDKAGRIRYQHYADSMSDIPSNQSILGILDKLNQEEYVGAGDTPR